jgi:hypothetical protein
MSKNVSRRAMLAGAAAMPATSAAFAGPIENDVELLALGARLEPIAQEWLAQRAADDIDHREFEAEVERATGVACCDQVAPEEYPWPPDSYWAIREKIVKEHPCEDPELTSWNRIHARLYPLVDDILARKARPLAGLAVQAKAITLAVPELWDGGLWDGDVPETRERVFIEAVCAFVGVEVPSRTAGRGGATQCRIPGQGSALDKLCKTPQPRP